MNSCQCLNPDCLKKNPNNSQYCQHCGQNLLLVQRYRALRILGQGGFGRTFLAIDEFKPSKPFCVIKQFLPQAQGTSNLEKAGELFEQEAKHLENLGKHPQIPELMAYFIQDERQYLVQEYIAGETLARELERNGVFKEAEIWQLLTDILGILKYVHENNVIHRDIKPENLIRRSKDNKIVLVDFGASKLTEEKSLTVTGTVIGSARYTSPEQGRGKPKYCSDLYSLGVTCLYLLTQVSPYELYSIDEGEWVWRDFLGDNAVSDKLGKILDKLVESAVKRRYQTVDEVLSDLSVGVPGLLNSHQLVEMQGLPPQNLNIPNSQPQIYPYPETSIPNLVYSAQNKVKPSLTPTITENLPNNIKLEMALIPAGSFLMGTEDDEIARLCEQYEVKWFNREKPRHEVTLKAFYACKYPVTQAQYRAVMGNNPSSFKGQNNPVECVSWNDAQEFCRKLSQLTGKTYQLPSESQWEYACRSQKEREGTEYYYGDDKSQLKDYAWYYGNSNSQTHPVGQKKPNNWGLYDMHGNVWEWCEDDWVDNYNNTPRDGTAHKDPFSSYSVLRGGSWNDLPVRCRAAACIRGTRHSSNREVGFRVILVV